MTLRCLAVALLEVAAASLGAQEAPARPSAIVTGDNDLVVGHYHPGKRVTVPRAVWARIRGVADSAQRTLGPIVGITAPEGKRLFVVELADPSNAASQALIAFDPARGTATRNPPLLAAQWVELGVTSGLLEKPLVHFEDLDGDGHPEWVVEQIAHTGAGYTAAVYHYFQLRPDLSLRRVCALELRAFDPASEGGARRLVRMVTRVGPSKLQLVTLLQVPDSGPRRVAVAMLESHGAGQPFMVMERRALDPRYEFAVITALRWAHPEADESRFLREGAAPP
jgi:hypothetical protein